MAEQEPKDPHFWPEAELWILLVLPKGQQKQLVWHLQEEAAGRELSAAPFGKFSLGTDPPQEPSLPIHAEMAAAAQHQHFSEQQQHQEILGKAERKKNQNNSPL